MSKQKTTTTVGVIDDQVLAFTAGKDVDLDRHLIDADCMGTAAHVTMLSKMPLKPKFLTAREVREIIGELVAIMKASRTGTFAITLADQDVHLAVERTLTERLGELGKKIHTGRSRNDQVAVDLRLFMREQLLGCLADLAELAGALLAFAESHQSVPMVGRTHMQPGMPSSVGLWASSYAESLLEDSLLVMTAYDLNDLCPLGSAAGYGVPLPIDRQLTSDLLGFSAPGHNVLHANNSRGKLESVILMAMTQIMLTLSRFAQDLMLFTMPEFGYFTLPAAYTTGSSIMPQKRNPDVLELVRAKAARVEAAMVGSVSLLRGLPSGYNRDLQELKEPLMEGVGTTLDCLAILAPMVPLITVHQEALLRGFTPEVFATDAALEKVRAGVPFRDAYHDVKSHLEELINCDPHEAIAAKTHLGGTAGLDFTLLQDRVHQLASFASDEWTHHCQAVSKLLGIRYPQALDDSEG